MCTRKQAIQIIVKEKSGNKKDLRKKIGTFYESFVTLGFITELLPVPKEFQKPLTIKNVDWEVTELAVKKAKFFRLNTLEM